MRISDWSSDVCSSDLPPPATNIPDPAAPAEKPSDNPVASKWSNVPNLMVPSLAGTKPGGDTDEPGEGNEAGANAGTDDLPAEPFTESQLIIFWAEYAGRLQAAGRATMHTLMTTFPPQLQPTFPPHMHVAHTPHPH